MAGQGTRALDLLRRQRVEHVVHEYEAAAPSGRARAERPAYGLEAARALGVEPDRVFKTIVATVDGRLVLAIVPVNRTLDLRALAAAVGGRAADLADPADAERATGYVVGGISPLGSRRPIPAVLDEGAFEHERILVSAGRRGLQVELAPDDLARLANATGARIARTNGSANVVNGTE
jgi:Cys-tRNA(Pro)/Cys-tRNA(Cys) deacylase